MSKHDPSLEEYMDAVWAFMLEHSDVSPRGSYFIKFRTYGRQDLEKRIRARYKYGYHRIDDRTNETHVEKEQRASAQREEHVQTRKRKREIWKASREERARVFAELKRMQEWRKRYGKLYPVLNYIHKLYTTLTRSN